MIADVILLILGVAAMGATALQAGELLVNFATKTVNATTEEDLDEAAKYLAEAVALIGVQVVMTLLFAKAPKVFSENPRYPTLKMKDLPKNKTPMGEWFYKPKTRAVDSFPRAGVLGTTSIYGDIKYLSELTGKLKDETILHERIHSILTPKLYPLRNFRVTLAMNGYNKSFLLRYLEEAIAETAAQVGVYGFKNAVVGVRFPIKGNYVSLAAMKTEIKGIFLGPINCGAASYRAYLTNENE